MVHGILRHRVCVGQVGHPGTVLEGPSNYGTRDTQTQGLCGASWISRDSPECPSNSSIYMGDWQECPGRE